MLVAKGTTNFLDLVGFGVQGSTDEKENALGIQALRLFVQSFRSRFAIDDAIDGREVMNTSPAHFLFFHCSVAESRAIA